MENVLQTLDPKLCIICGKHFEKGKKKDPYVQSPTVEGLQRILTLAQQRDDDVHKTLAPYTDDILSSKIKVSYHVSCRANYCSKTKISEQQQVENVESESTSAPRRLSRADTTSFKIRRDCFICGKASSRPEPLTAISTGTGASTRDKVLGQLLKGLMKMYIFEFFHAQISLHMMQNTIKCALHTTSLSEI